jgi:hypothetical protein
MKHQQKHLDVKYRLFPSHNAHNNNFTHIPRKFLTHNTHKFSSPQTYAIRRHGLLTACINNFQIHPRIRLTWFTKCFLICGYIALKMTTKSKNKGWNQLKSFNWKNIFWCCKIEYFWLLPFVFHDNIALLLPLRNLPNNL